MFANTVIRCIHSRILLTECASEEEEVKNVIRQIHVGYIKHNKTETPINPRGDHWAEFGPRDQCRLCARPKFGPIWYDVVEQFSFPSLVTDPGKKGVIGKLIHSSSCANFIQVQNAVSPNENPRYTTRGKVLPIFG